MNIFGRKKSKAPSVPGTSAGAPSQNNNMSNPQASLQLLKQRMENIEKRQEFINKKMMAQTNIAKEKMKAGDKRGALFALKTKKLYEKEIEKLDASLITLQSQTLAIESASVNLDVITGMQVGKNALQQIHKQVDLNAVQDLQDEIQEGLSSADEINGLISQPVGDAYDDDELLGELDQFESELGEEELEVEVPKVKTAKAAVAKPPIKKQQDIDLNLPDAPTTMLNMNTADADDEDARALKELEAQMAL